MFSIAEIKDYVKSLYDNKYGKVSRDNVDITLKPFFYNVSSGTPIIIAPGSSVQVNLPITANADFVATRLQFKAYVGNVENVSPLIRLLITDSGSNEQLMDKPSNIGAFMASTNNDVRLPYPQLFSGRTAVTFAFTNYSGVDTYSLEVVAHGVLVRGYN